MQVRKVTDKEQLEAIDRKVQIDRHRHLIRGMQI